MLSHVSDLECRVNRLKIQSEYASSGPGMSVSDTGQGEITGTSSTRYKGGVPKLKVTPTALVFIRVVPTVVVVVTLPAAWYAAVVLTPELVWLTCPFSCTKHTEC